MLNRPRQQSPKPRESRGSYVVGLQDETGCGTHVVPYGIANSESPLPLLGNRKVLRYLNATKEICLVIRNDLTNLVLYPTQPSLQLVDDLIQAGWCAGGEPLSVGGVPDNQVLP